MTRRLGLIGLLVAVLPLPAEARQVAESPHGPLPESLDCSACHTSGGWTPLLRPLAFDHDRATGFTLTGAHARAACASCHLDLRFDGPDIPMDDCAGCHADVHQGRMLRACADCHDAISFHGVDGEEAHARTSFPLTGAHRQIACESCHTDDVGGSFVPLETECAACHAEDYASARTVDHVANAYPTDCTSCHSTLGWSDAPTFDHAAVANGFELLGVHDGLRCASCHTLPDLDPIFRPAGQDDCVACHQDDYDQEHGGSSFPTTCTTCHGVDGWDVESFDHGLTGFPLVERHASISCQDCHAADGGLRFPTPADGSDCVACHLAEYENKHLGSGFPTTCLSCHDQRDWEAQGSFDHAATGFSLEGAHATAPCATCHGGADQLASRPAGPEDCVSCHTVSFEAAHGAGSGFPTTCADCHDPVTWAGATADHVTLSNGFLLDGPHATATCTACHAVPGYALLFPAPSGNADCVACHQAQFDREHGGSGFPTTCTDCHASDRWTGATLDHPQVSGGFRLLGAHQGSACTACHVVPRYALLFPRPSDDQDCVACHQDRYDQAHAGSGYPTDCASCHTVSAWQPSTFDHERVFILESGPHREKWSACADCHTSPSDVTTFTCFACHEHAQPTMDEKHKAVSGYVWESGACLSCHPRGLR